MVQICGAGVVPIVFKTCGNWGGRDWSLILFHEEYKVEKSATCSDMNNGLS